MDDNNFLPKLSQNLLEILNDDEYCDITIEVGIDPYVKIFRAHMNILDYRSPYLKRILSTNKKKNDETLVQIKLQNISPEIFQIILRYIYGGKLSLKECDTSDIIKILVAANELSLHELVTYLQSFLIKSKRNWMEQNFNLVYQTSFENDSFLELQKYCNDSISKEPDKIFKSPNFSSISEKVLVTIIRNDNLQMEEIQVWEHVLKWGISQNPELPSDPKSFSKDDFNTLRNTLQQCIPFIKLFNITSKEFFNKVYPYKKIISKELRENLFKHFLDRDENSESNSSKNNPNKKIAPKEIHENLSLDRDEKPESNSSKHNLYKKIAPKELHENLPLDRDEKSESNISKNNLKIAPKELHENLSLDRDEKSESNSSKINLYKKIAAKELHENLSLDRDEKPESNSSKNNLYKKIATKELHENLSLDRDEKSKSNISKNNLKIAPKVLHENLSLDRDEKSESNSSKNNPNKKIAPKKLYENVFKYLFDRDEKSESNSSKNNPNKKIAQKELHENLSLYRDEKSESSSSKNGIDSRIITSQHAELISKWVDKLNTITDKLTSSYEFKLLFRGSRDGFTPKEFNKICDEQSHTITIIKVKDSDEILGGYNPITWKLYIFGGYGNTKDSFIFSFKINDSIENYVLSRVIDESNAISYINSHYGPSFGYQDLTICRNNFNNCENWCKKSSYEKPIRKTEEKFSVEEYEVYQIKKN